MARTPKKKVDIPAVIEAYAASGGLLEKGGLPEELTDMLPRYHDAGASEQVIGMAMADVEAVVRALRGFEAEMKNIKAHVRDLERELKRR